MSTAPDAHHKPQRKPANSVPTALVEASLAGARRQGITLSPILSLTDSQGRSLQQLLEDAESRVELALLGNALTSLWQLMDDETAGFLDRPLRSGTFALMCHANITSPNLRRALLRNARMTHLLCDSLRYEIEESGDQAELIIHYDNPDQLDESFFICSLFILWIRWSCWFINRPILLERIHFRYPKPDYADEYNQLFPCRHYFSQGVNKVVFSSHFLDLPVAQTVQSQAEFLRNAPACLLTQFRTDRSITARIRRLLQAGDNVENLGFEEVSQHFATTTHTLRRRLKEEGNSFQEIKDSVRRGKAVYHLSHKTTSINDIAAMTGFSDPAAFNRAFKKWTGMTPGQYREQAHS